MSERTTPQAIGMLARELFKAGAASLVLAVQLPRERSFMHLDTVLTMVDRDAVTLFSDVIEAARVWKVEPGDDPEMPEADEFDGGVVEAIRSALGVGIMRVINTGGDPFGTLREQWNNGNNVLCI